MSGKFSFKAMGPTFPRAGLIKVHRKLSKFLEMYMRDICVTFTGGLLHRRCNHSNLVVCPVKPFCDAALPNRRNYLSMSGHKCETETLAALVRAWLEILTFVPFPNPTSLPLCLYFQVGSINTRVTTLNRLWDMQSYLLCQQWNYYLMTQKGTYGEESIVWLTITSHAKALMGDHRRLDYTPSRCWYISETAQRFLDHMCPYQ